METPTIVKQTKNYMLVKIPLPRQTQAVLTSTVRETPLPAVTAAEKRLRKALQESERDVKAGRVITARNITEALRRYEKRQWD